MSWDAEQYLKFADERLRPALDLLAQVPLAAPVRVVDLGCGTGNVTRLLRARWTQALITGVDNSPVMLQRARGELPDAHFEERTVEAWQPDTPVDLIFSNAALHWVGDHPELFPRLIAALAPGGVLAVQMPGNFAAPSHSLVRELAESSAWAGRVGEGRMGSILDMADYHRLLAPRVSRLALWETRYWQALRGASAVREWLQGTTLRPYLTPLTEAEQAEFLDTLDDLLLTAYPVDGEGVTLFPFRRVFMVAVR